MCIQEILKDQPRPGHKQEVIIIVMCESIKEPYTEPLSRYRWEVSDVEVGSFARRNDRVVGNSFKDCSFHQGQCKADIHDLFPRLFDTKTLFDPDPPSDIGFSSLEMWKLSGLNNPSS